MSRRLFNSNRSKLLNMGNLDMDQVVKHIQRRVKLLCCHDRVSISHGLYSIPLLLIVILFLYQGIQSLDQMRCLGVSLPCLDKGGRERLSFTVSPTPN